jgi:hypothetical protein
VIHGGGHDLFGGPRQLASTPDNQAGWQPPGSLPCHSTLRYAKDAVTVLVMLVALPWLLWNLVTRPHSVMRGSGIPT